MTPVFLIALVAVAMIGVMVPSVFATSGEIFLEKNEFVLYGDGSVVNFSVTGEIFDYVYYPKLEIMIDNVVFQTVKVFPNKNSIFSIIGLDKNWSHGEYVVNLKYENEILDSKSFTIIRDNVVVKEIKTHPNMSETLESFIELDFDKLVLENNSDETIWISGNLASSQFGNEIKFSLYHPDGTIEDIGKIYHSHTDYFEIPIIGIDKFWMPGEYQIIVNYLDQQFSTSFIIENDVVLSSLSETHMYAEESEGSFDLSFEKFDQHVILKINGDVRTNDSEIKLIINTNDSIIYESDLPISDGNFYDNILLYDYEKDMSWENTEYEINAFVKQDIVDTKTFTFDESLIFSSNDEVMNLEMIFSDQVVNFSTKLEIEISQYESKEITLTGNIPNFSYDNVLDVDIATPSGEILESHLRTSASGDYFVPVILDDSWESGTYVVSLLFDDVIQDVVEFFVINHKYNNSQTVDNNSSVILNESLEILELE
ncbi:hypothetical protein, partial [Nitrosopumilus sp. Nsub]|uniref:hypothetical protein n=1 Tax=Nitrosopumilus sp. Nsub TaxID=1776294 RepID=UPI0012E38A87